MLFLRKLTGEEKKEVFNYAKYLLWRRTEYNRQAEKEEAGKESVGSVREDSPPYNGDDVVYLPLLGDAAAGQPIHIEELLEGYVPVNKHAARGKCFLIRAKGDSMIDAGIDDGDLFVIRKQPTVDNGEIALVRLNDEATVRYFFKEEGKIILMPANDNYKPIVRFDNISVIGKVIEIIGKQDAEKKMRFFHGDHDFFNNL